MSAVGAAEIAGTGLEVSQLGAGTASLGNVFGEVAEGAAEELVTAALENGVTYFDTAPLYGNGLSERRLGAALRQHPHAGVTLSTKVGRILDDSEPDGWRFDFSREGILRSIESSLERLGRDRIDLVYVHDPDSAEEALHREAWPTLEALKAEGVVSAIGIGMNQWEIPLRLVEQHEVDAVMLAGRATLLDQSAQATFLPACAERGVAVIGAGVFNSGVLVDPRDGAWFDYAPASPHILERARAIQRVLATYGIGLAHAALEYAASQQAVTSVVVGVGSAGTLRKNIAAFGSEVPQEAWDAIAEQGLIPAPAGK